MIKFKINIKIMIFKNSNFNMNNNKFNKFNNNN